MQHAMHEVLGSNPKVMHIYYFAFFTYKKVCTIMNQVSLSTYKIIPGLSEYILVRECTAYISVDSTTCLVCLRTYQVCLETYLECQGMKEYVLSCDRNNTVSYPSIPCYTTYLKFSVICGIFSVNVVKFQ